MAVIDDNLARSITEAFRLSQLDLLNQDIFFGGTGVVTITRADGSTMQISSPQKLMADVAKALPLTGAAGLTSRYRFSKGAYGITFDDVPSTGYGGVFAGWNNAPIAYNHNVTSNGQFFADTVHRYVYSGVAAGAFYTGLAASTTERSYAIGHSSDAGALTANWAFSANGSAYANNGSWVNSSDVRIKYKIARIEDPLVKMRAIKGCTWYRKDNGNFGIGFIAQDVQAVFPDAVTTNGMSLTMADGEVIKDVLFPDTAGVAAALHHEAILSLMAENEANSIKMESMSSELESLKLLVAQLSEQVKAKNQ